MSCLSCSHSDVAELIPETPCTLRLIVCNDVYILDNFPNFATAKAKESKGADKTIGLLAGDFLAPSLLSIMDKGVGMIDIMNHSGIDCVCIGKNTEKIRVIYQYIVHFDHHDL